MKTEEITKLWETMTDQDKQKTKRQVQDKLVAALAQAGQMRQDGQLSATAYKKVMDEFASQNPLYGMLLRGKL